MAVVETRKSGYREITGIRSGAGGDWEKAHDPDTGKTTWTSLNNNAKATIVWGPGDSQDHGAPGPIMKPGSKIVEWVDSGGKRHCEIERVE